ncbi:hypothetical protein BC628DRAFT_247397 [Trametes gibbosa]|nr:hypothetical protein BC628DRAFT_247397 [Trametes gibbosa]
MPGQCEGHAWSCECGPLCRQRQTETAWKRRIENRARQMNTCAPYVNSVRRVPRTVRRTRTVPVPGLSSGRPRTRLRNACVSHAETDGGKSDEYVAALVCGIGVEGVGPRVKLRLWAPLRSGAPAKDRAWEETILTQARVGGRDKSMAGQISDSVGRLFHVLVPLSSASSHSAVLAAFFLPAVSCKQAFYTVLSSTRGSSL